MTSVDDSRSIRTAVARRHRILTEDLRRLIDDSGVTVEQLARAAGLAPSYVRRLLARLDEPDPRHPSRHPQPSVETYQRLATALGADLHARIYPNTGPPIHDRHQTPMLEIVLGGTHPRWVPYTELRVRDPAKGWIDLGLHDPAALLFLAAELVSELRRLEQLLRWSEEKAASLPSWDGWEPLGPPPAISRLLVVRRTRANRDAVAAAARQLRIHYPAHPADALAALAGTAPWPGPAMLWVVLDGKRSRLVGER